MRPLKNKQNVDERCVIAEFYGVEFFSRFFHVGKLLGRCEVGAK
jgi:hypothetical protein